ncbi:MAG: organic solvent tolerance protein OstA [Culturomica sp.]|nr:organic solvent tolerance protein OstA [Culturomica sp.]
MKVLVSHIIIVFLLIAAGVPVVAQTTTSAKENTVKIRHADFFRPGISVNRNILSGKVEMEQNNILIFCDSLYQYTDTNYIEAFGHVHIIRNDTLHLWGDYASYCGDSEKAIVRRNVHLNNGNIDLYTQFLDYDMDTNIGYYFNSGILKDSVNTLTSKLGYYYADENKLFFNDSVNVVSPDYNMFADTLIYNTVSKVINIEGPTNIYGKERTLYSENGWYNSVTSHVELYEKNRMTFREYVANADTIVIDSISGTAFMHRNIHLFDSVNNIITEGDYGELFRNTEYAYITDNSLLILAGEKDSLFIHSDTLSHAVIKDSTGVAVSKLLKAYYHTQFYNKDLQGVCDSMTFFVQDSTVYLDGSPIVWASDNQMTAVYIDMLLQNNVVKEFHLNDKAMIVNPIDTNRYNQIKGRNMIGYMKNNELELVDVNGNGESIYFYEEKNDILLNKAVSSLIKIYLNQRKIKDIEFITQVDGSLTPWFLVKPEELYLSDFHWYIDLKPLTKEDIFVWKRDSTSTVNTVKKDITKRETTNRPSNNTPTKQTSSHKEENKNNKVQHEHQNDVREAKPIINSEGNLNKSKVHPKSRGGNLKTFDIKKKN